MSLFWVVVGAIALGAALGLVRWIGLFLRAFILAMAAGLMLHYQADPTQAVAGMAALGGGWMVARKLTFGGLFL